MRKLLLSFFAVFCLQAPAAKCQIAIGIKWMGFTAHLKEYPYSKFYRGKLDKRGRFVLTDGLALGVDFYLNENFFIKIAQAWVAHDCGSKFLGMSHLGLGYSVNEFYPFQGSVSFGPMYFYRRNWHGSVPEYSDPTDFFRVSRKGKWQTKFVWHGGQIEVDFFVKPNQAFSLNVVPAVPELFTFTPGWKFVPKR